MSNLQKSALFAALLVVKFAMIAALMHLGGCASGPPTPQWQIEASDSLRRATEGYLEGRTKAIPTQTFEAELHLARGAVRATGQVARLAKLELAFCAAQVAALDAKALDACAAFEPHKADADAPDLAYERYLHGRASAADASALPEQHRASALAISSGNLSPATLAAMTAMTDPLAQLIAASSALQAKQAGPEIVALAVNTASAQGWRRPLLAWLGVQLKLAQSANDPVAAQAIERRILLASTQK